MSLTTRGACGQGVRNPARRGAAMLCAFVAASCAGRSPPVPPGVAPSSRSGDTPVRAAVEAGLDWLVRHQDPDGGWRASRFTDRCRGPGCGGGAAFAVDDAVTGLALLALARAPETARPPEATAALRRGLDHLVRIQEPDGRIGFPDPRAAHFNHILPALALLESSARADAPEPAREAARRAFDRAAHQVRTEMIDDCQAPWYAMAFCAGEERGWRVAGPGHERLLYWLRWGRDNSQNVTRAIDAAWVICLRAAGTPAGSLEMRAHLDAFADALPPEDRNDLFLGYLGLAGLQEAEDPRAAAWGRAIEERILHLQRPQTDGCPAGSWDPDRMWGSAGGRVYATAFAALILERVGAGL